MDSNGWLTLVAFLLLLPAVVLGALAFERRGNRTQTVPEATTTATPVAFAEELRRKILQARFPGVTTPTFRTLRGTDVPSTDSFPVVHEGLVAYTVPASRCACAFNWMRLVNPTTSPIGPVTLGLYSAVTTEPVVRPLATFESVGANGGQQVVNTLRTIMHATDRLLLWAPPGLNFEVTVLEWAAEGATDTPFPLRAQHHSEF